jgi:DNA polymerase-3 subunit chi
MKVDFYVYENVGKQQALRELCLLLEAPYAEKQPIHLHTTSASEADLIDKLLWTYREDSFLAHQVIAEDNDMAAPIQIGVQTPPVRIEGVLVNLSADIPAFYSGFQRVIELVYADPTVQQAARDRFRQYREQGCDINTHKMKVTPA